MRARTLTAIGAVVFVVDHATKWLAIEHLKGQPPVDIVPGLFRLDYAENTGGAFSVMAHSPGALTLMACASLALVFWFLSHTSHHQTGTRLGLALLLGGAAANLVDRFFRGAVVDFFDAYWGAYHWPTFNVADSAICVGAGLFVLFGMPEGLAGDIDPEKDAAEPAPPSPPPAPAPSAAKTRRRARKDEKIRVKASS
jgi:signal peptidase II